MIGAHVNGEDGLLQCDGEQRIAVLRNTKLAGVEVQPDVDCDSNWLDGSKPEVGRKLSQVWGSDSHSFDSIGQRFTWIKMTKPNLEGLRLALLDGEASLKPTYREDVANPNSHANLVIESITVSRREIDRPQYAYGSAFQPLAKRRSSAAEELASPP